MLDGTVTLGREEQGADLPLSLAILPNAPKVFGFLQRAGVKDEKTLWSFLQADAQKQDEKKPAQYGRSFCTGAS